MRMTSQRKAILNILNTFKKPMSAEMIFNRLSPDSINLSTIYRTLERFFLDGQLSRDVINHTSYYFLNQEKHKHYMLCMKCQKMIPIDCHVEEAIHAVEDKASCMITHHDLTFYGYCKNCKPTE